MSKKFVLVRFEIEVGDENMEEAENIVKKIIKKGLKEKPAQAKKVIEFTINYLTE